MKSVRINKEMRKQIAAAIVEAQGYEEQKAKAREELSAQMRVTAEKLREAWYTKEQIDFIERNPEMFHKSTLYMDYRYSRRTYPAVEMSHDRVIKECEHCVKLSEKIDRIKGEETTHLNEMMRYLAQFNTTKQLVEAAPKFEKVLDKLFSEQTTTTAPAPAIQYAAVQSLVNGYLRAGR